jgi:lipid-binding SYLF domain-containing protein
VQAFADDPNMEGLRERARNARAILIVPEALRAAFFIGASSGGGILVVRDSPTKTWRGPAFYAMTGASIGLEMGADASEIICLVMTQRGLDSFLRSSFKLGIDASIAAGSDGNRIGAGTSPLLSADMIVFARSKGAFMGISMEGVIVRVAESANQAYHGDAFPLADVLHNELISKPPGAELLQALEALTR